MKRIPKKIKSNAEVGARRALLEELFYDFYKTRHHVFFMNFMRGIFFGVGSVIGGTLIVALAVWLLSLLGDIPGGVGDFINYIVETVQSANRD